MVISVTTTGGAAIAMDDSNIIALVVNADNSNYSDITYQDNKNVLKKVTVTSTAAVVAALSADIIALNVFDDSSFVNFTARYFNAKRISPVIVDNTSHRLMTYNTQGFIYDQLAIQNSLSAIVNLINQGSSEYVTIAGAQTVVGAKTFSAALAATSTLSVGTNQTFAKEVNHAISVVSTTTAATAGGDIEVGAGAGATSGAGGAATLAGGEGGATGAGGEAVLLSGDGGATSGNSGDAIVRTGDAVVGGTGDVLLATGDTASGLAGDIILTTGVGTSTTVCPVVSLGKAVVHRPTSTAVATGATASIIGTISGSLAVTGATGNVTLPTGTQISTAIGSVTAGTYFDLIVNAIGMTSAADVCTIAVAAGVVTAKQISAGDSATNQLLTVTNTAALNIGVFRFVNIAANSWSLHRMA